MNTAPAIATKEDVRRYATVMLLILVKWCGRGILGIARVLLSRFAARYPVNRDVQEYCHYGVVLRALSWASEIAWRIQIDIFGRLSSLTIRYGTMTAR